MHDIEPFYQWRHLYKSEEDKRSLFYGKQYSEFDYSCKVYNYYLHPQWDCFGSETLYIKVLFADYTKKFLILECIGEWNDALYDDFFQLWDNCLTQFSEQSICDFILVGESIFNFHASPKSRYNVYADLWNENHISFSLINLAKPTMNELIYQKINSYFNVFEIDNWRTYLPQHLFKLIKNKESLHAFST